LPSVDDEDKDIAIFVTEPAGYDVPVDANNVPHFDYIHKPDGSPLSIYRFVGQSDLNGPPRHLA
jgi:hypothetical protein